jgi:hypothetical protein
MSSYDDDHLDGNAAAGDLAMLFALDVTAAEGQCAHCGATAHFADAHLYLGGPGLVARCSHCSNVLLRFARVEARLLLDLRGMTRLVFETGAATP